MACNTSNHKVTSLHNYMPSLSKSLSSSIRNVTNLEGVTVMVMVLLGSFMISKGWWNEAMVGVWRIPLLWICWHWRVQVLMWLYSVSDLMPPLTGGCWWVPNCKVSLVCQQSIFHPSVAVFPGYWYGQSYGVINSKVTWNGVTVILLLLLQWIWLS